MKHANTRNNHYVPRFYLKYFSRDNFIYIKILKKNQIKKINVKSLGSFASQNNLYTLHTDKLNLALIREGYELTSKAIEDNSMDNIIYHDLSIFLLDKMKRSLLFKAKPSHPDYPVIEFLKDRADGTAISRNAELLLNHFESKAKVVLDRIIHNQSSSPMLTGAPLHERGRITRSFLYYYLADSIYQNLIIHINECFLPNETPRPQFLDSDELDKDSQDYIYLIYYIVLQILRTPNAFDEFNHENANIPPCNSRFEWIMAMFCNSIYITSNYAIKNYKIILIRNESNLDFITSDSPVVDIPSNKLFDEVTKDDIIHYFPISPRHALYVTNCEKFAQIDSLPFDEGKVHQHNKLIYKHASNFIFAPQQNTLNKYTS